MLSMYKHYYNQMSDDFMDLYNSLVDAYDNINIERITEEDFTKLDDIRTGVIILYGNDTTACFSIYNFTRGTVYYITSVVLNRDDSYLIRTTCNFEYNITKSPNKYIMDLDISLEMELGKPLKMTYKDCYYNHLPIEDEIKVFSMVVS